MLRHRLADTEAFPAALFGRPAALGLRLKTTLQAFLAASHF